jgi:hypothetical protein
VAFCRTQLQEPAKVRADICRHRAAARRGRYQYEQTALLHLRHQRFDLGLAPGLIVQGQVATGTGIVYHRQGYHEATIRLLQG